MKQILLLISYVLLLNTPSFSGTWFNLPSLPGNDRGLSVAFSANGKFYCGTGMSTDMFGNTTYYSDFWSYDPATGLWTQVADFVSVAGAYGFTVGGYGYVGGGQNGSFSYSGVFQKYDHNINIWLDYSHIWAPPLDQVAVFVINNNAYLVGGGSFGGGYNMVIEFNSTLLQFDLITPLGGYNHPNPSSLARYGASAFTVNGKGYVGTGFNSFGGFEDLWEFDPSTSTWTQKANFPGGYRGGTSSFALGNYGYMGLGYNPQFNMVFDDIRKYDPLTDTWTYDSNMPIPRFNGASATIGSAAYICTGMHTSLPQYYNAFQKYETCTGPGYTYITPTGNLNVCFGNSITLTANTTNPGTYTYQWYKNQIPISGATSATYNASQNGNYSVRASNACNGHLTGASTLTVVDPPIVYITSGGSNAICTGDVRTLNSNNTSAFSSYQWFLNGNIISNATGNSYNATSPGSYTVSATNMCGSSASSPWVITLNDPGTVISANGSTGFCTGGSVLLTSSNTGTGLSYQWKRNGNIISGAIASSYTATTTGNYTLNVTNTCGSITSNVIQVTVYGSVPSTPSTISGPANFCPYQQGVVYSIPLMSTATSYNWLVPQGAVIVSGQGTHSIVVNFANKGGNIKVQAINPCGSGGYRNKKVNKSNCRIMAPENTQDIDKVAVYPNPASGVLWIELNASNKQPFSIRLMDITGHVVYTNTKSMQEDESTFGIDIAKLPAGMYMLTIEIDGIIETKKVMIN